MRLKEKLTEFTNESRDRIETVGAGEGQLESQLRKERKRAAGWCGLCARIEMAEQPAPCSCSSLKTRRRTVKRKESREKKQGFFFGSFSETSALLIDLGVKTEESQRVNVFFFFFSLGSIRL